ncbi:hypothetical protein PILCRDRAFT_15776 [Piloderma croceum F 1598]|uniref:Uncharacterized protein n=1 Tax=Piloderma croceum (strain F 1598) TaxID=765440 RepID=A0A0C3EXV0_PILCF|nr:hypothetical protein PILCRDRAFT_15776 [Piloderma croceum F 1598]
MEKKYAEHPVYKWSTERLDDAMTKFHLTFIFELQDLIVAEYELTDTLLETGVIDENAWEAKTNTDYPVLSLKFRNEPIEGPDYRQFEVFRLLRETLGLGWHPVIKNMEEFKRETKTSVILGISVVTDEGTRKVGPGWRYEGRSDDHVG